MPFVCPESYLNDSPESIPERVCLAAILERSVRDLGAEVASQERRSAIAWFRAPVTSKLTIYFTWTQVKLELDLTDGQVDHILSRVAIAERIEERLKRECADGKCLSQGEARRIASSELAERVRDIVGPQDTTAQRRRRRVGRQCTRRVTPHAHRSKGYKIRGTSTLHAA